MDLHQWRLEALLWIRQLLILRAAALWRYTAFFIMAGSFASISAAQMHSSKNPAYMKCGEHIFISYDLIQKETATFSGIVQQNDVTSSSKFL